MAWSARIDVQKQGGIGPGIGKWPHPPQQFIQADPATRHDTIPVLGHLCVEATSSKTQEAGRGIGSVMDELRADCDQSLID